MIERQISYTEELIFSLQYIQNCPLKKETKPLIELQWTGTQFEFVELVYALHDTGSINGGKLSLKEMFSLLGDILNFCVTDYYRFFTSITNRQGDRTLYLDKLKKAFMQHLLKSDNR